MAGRLLTAIAVLYASLALLLAELQCEPAKEPKYEQNCKEAPPRLSIENLDNTCLMFVYDKTRGICVDDFVKYENESSAYHFFHECVANCNTSQGALDCAKRPKFTSNCTSDCDEYYYYDIEAQTCLTMNISITAPPTPNVFFSELGCKTECMGFNLENVNGTNRTQTDVS
uniref:Putative secreted protein n=1 Tax=Amblyomma triste TaxID=251400 RepID=A0A023G9W6_AMBTT